MFKGQVGRTPSRPPPTSAASVKARTLWYCEAAKTTNNIPGVVKVEDDDGDLLTRTPRDFRH